MPNLTQCDSKAALKEQLAIFKFIGYLAILATMMVGVFVAVAYTKAYPDATLTTVITAISALILATVAVAVLSWAIYAAFRPSIDLLLCLVGLKDPPDGPEPTNSQP